MLKPFAALGLLLLSGCVEQADIPTVPEQILPFAISLSTNSITRGQSTTITVTLTNDEEFDVQMSFPTACQARLFIRNVQGAYVTPPNGNHNCASVQTFLSLAPGESRSYTYQWSGETQYGPPGSGTPLPAGTYYASADLLSDQYTGIAFPVAITLIGE